MEGGLSVEIQAQDWDHVERVKLKGGKGVFKFCC